MTLVTLLLILAMFAQVCLVMVVLLKMRSARVKAIKDGVITMERAAIDPMAWPLDVRKIQNNYINQFEIPVLFFVACLVLINSIGVGWVSVILSWIFVISRWVHMFIHTGSNRIKYRFKAFLVGMICVSALWIVIAVKSFQLYLIG